MPEGEKQPCKMAKATWCLKGKMHRRECLRHKAEGVLHPALTQGTLSFTQKDNPGRPLNEAA